MIYAGKDPMPRVLEKTEGQNYELKRHNQNLAYQNEDLLVQLEAQRKKFLKLDDDYQKLAKSCQHQIGDKMHRQDGQG